jgi:two-component system LytT family sensor kinase
MRDEVSFRAGESPNWRRVWVGFLLFWTTFAVVGTWLNYQFLVARGRPISWAQSFRINIVGYAIWAFVLTPAILLLCARLPLARRNWFRIVLAHLFCIAGALCADVLIKTLLHRMISLPNSPALAFSLRFREYFFHETEPDVQIYLMVAVIAYVIAYYVDLRSQERRAAELQTDLVRAELQVLKMQLQPHFLFNTLHSVAALVNTDPRAAQRMICSLGDLLRMSLVGEDAPEVTLRRELEFLKVYFDIQKVRFQDRLVTEINVASEVLGAKVPYLLLQPLAENAIKHGVGRRSGWGKVEISAYREADNICIFVVNDNGVSHAAPEQGGLGIGLENIRSRLRILYGAKGRLSAQDLSDGRFQVEVRVPFQEDPMVEREVRSLSIAGAGAGGRR